jgi:hypothetical protein
LVFNQRSTGRARPSAATPSCSQAPSASRAGAVLPLWQHGPLRRGLHQPRPARLAGASPAAAAAAAAAAQAPVLPRRPSSAPVRAAPQEGLLCPSLSLHRLHQRPSAPAVPPRPGHFCPPVPGAPLLLLRAPCCQRGLLRPIVRGLPLLPRGRGPKPVHPPRAASGSCCDRKFSRAATPLVIAINSES